jgi:alkylation response protein AidB-like acyl-CoA dehydrogenase
VDLHLTDEQREIIDLFATVADRAGLPASVRDHEALGFWPELWDQLVAVGAPGMGVAADAGGGGAALLDLSLAAESLGARLAPVPFVEHLVAARLLARSLDVDAAARTAVIDGASIATIALRPAGEDHVARLVPGGAVASWVIGRDTDQLVATHDGPPDRAVANLGSAPLADRSLATGERRVLARGPEARAGHEAALNEWRALSAAALVGLGLGALEIGRAYVTQREQFGVPIGSFQAIQHTLADVSVALDGAQLLARKAAWALDRGAEDRSTLAAYAFLFAAEQAQRATERVLHFHGGYGFMQEYDIQLFYRRAKAWPLVLGAPSHEYARLAARRYGELPEPLAG